MKKQFTFDGQYTQKQPKRRRVKINQEWDHLTQMSVAAQNAGMSYGKYVAMLYEKKQRKAALERSKKGEEKDG